MAESPSFVSFRERGGWDDVEPISLSEDDRAVVDIAYKPEVEEVMGYFRAIVQRDERSVRALALTKEVISVNAANYTAWHYLRRCIKDTGVDVRQELQYVEKLALKNPKNYQVWFHRRRLVELLGDATQEKEFTAACIEADSKNYHAWSHRQWAVRTFGLWDGELAYTQDLLRQDPRNNSAWNHRFFVLTASEGKLSESDIESEVEFAFSHIRRAPNNESPWNYVQGVALRGERGLETLRSAVEALAEKFPACRFAQALLGEILSKEDSDESMARAQELFLNLATKTDTIREKYWRFCAHKLGERGKE